MIVELKKKSTIHGLADRLNLFEHLSNFSMYLMRYIDWLKFEHCLSARLVQGPILITKGYMIKSDLTLCAQKYTVCYVLAQIMIVNSFMAHLYEKKLQCSSKQKYHQEAWKCYGSRSNLT